MAKNQTNTAPNTDSIKPWQRINKLRRLHLLSHLFKHGSISRQHADEVAPAANSPAELIDLRRKGFEMPCDRATHVTVDGKQSWYGLYQLTDEDRDKAAEVLRLNWRAEQ